LAGLGRDRVLQPGVGRDLGDRRRVDGRDDEHQRAEHERADEHVVGSDERDDADEHVVDDDDDGSADDDRSDDR
jgi:hypothetical protein